jgi:exopolyphosphatase / guanosine-5'-triphosphate,3'-diphosphate pyrophosphatase
METQTHSATGAAAPDGSGPQPPFPLRVASIDVGSNAMRVLCAEFSAPATYRLLAEERVPVRLGHDVFLTGRLAEEVQVSAIAALRAFRTRIEAFDITHARAVATSAVREASNGERFVERVAEEAGVQLEVITGSEEARLVHVAVRSRIPMSGGRWIMVDLGGGSVEVSLADERGIHWSESHTMGSVRLLEELSIAGGEPGRFRELLEEYTATLRIPSTTGEWTLLGLIATGGNIETLARLAGCTASPEGVSVLEVSALREVIGTLAKLSYRQRVEQLGLREDRADVILPAAMVYERVSTLASAERIHVPHIGVKEGVLLDLVDTVTRPRRHGDRISEDAYAGALALGRRYLFDEEHGAQVSRLAGELFDQLSSLHGMSDDDRRILCVAAALHDVGVFISAKKHHKHSHYVLANSELPGFTPREIQMVAVTARYHRKGVPAPHHSEFMALTEEERVRVVRLASLLRIAAALDKEHRQRVQSLRIRRRGSTVDLELRGSGSLLLERWALTRNVELFEATFAVEVRVRESAAPARP